MDFGVSISWLIVFNKHNQRGSDMEYGWIDAVIQKPQQEGRYIVFLKKEMRVDVARIEDFELQFCESIYTHWMPIPEDPKKEWKTNPHCMGCDLEKTTTYDQCKQANCTRVPK